MSNDEPKGRTGLYPWFVVIVLMLLYTSSFIDRQILSLMIAPIRADLGLSDTGVSLLGGLAFGILYAVAGIPLGLLVDRWNRRKLIALGVAAWSLMTAACAFAKTFGGFFLARVGVGVGEAALAPAAYSLLADYFPPHRLGRAISVYGFGIPIGAGAAYLIGGEIVSLAVAAGTRTVPLLGEFRPWQMVFLAIGLPGLLLSLLALLIREPKRRVAPGETTANRPSTGDVVRWILAHRRLYRCGFFGYALLSLFGYGGLYWLPTYLMRVYGLGLPQVSLLFGVATLVLGLSGSLTAGLLADWMTARGRTDAHSTVGTVYCAGMLVCGTLGPLVPSAALAAVLLGALAFFSGTWTGMAAAGLQLATPNRMRGQVSAIYLLVVSLVGLGLGPTAVALATDYLFKSDMAVGKSLALVAFVSCGLGVVLLNASRAGFRRRYAELAAEPEEMGPADAI